MFYNKYNKMKKISKKNKFIEKGLLKFSNNFDYSEVDYKNSMTKVKIKCNIHNEFFLQTPAEHIRGKKCCKKCLNNKIVDTDSFILKSREKHGEKYNYSLTKYVDSKTKVKIICNTHGVFETLPNNHLKNNCPKCYDDKRGKIIKLDKNKFISKAKEVHSDAYDYSLVEYIDNKTKVLITCKKHGDFEQLPYNHLRGKGCSKCAKENQAILLKDNFEKFVNKSAKKHGDKYDYSSVEFNNIRDKVVIDCPIHGKFEQSPYIHYNHGCQKCGLSYDNTETEIREFLTEYGIKFIEKDRTTIKPLELDIYIPSHNLAIEFNGLFWHSELYKSINYHLNKTELCNDKGVRLIHIFEDEWLYKKEIVKSRILNLLGLTKHKIYGRTTQIKLVDNRSTYSFLEQNHLQGYVNSNISIGLYNKDELVSIMTFGKSRIALGGRTDEYELIRFCNKLNTNVIGGADKLLKYFIQTYKVTDIISYADRRWSKGELYEKLGFNFSHHSNPNYWYIINGQRKHRFGFRKSILIKDGYDKNKSEHEIMLDRKIYRIYDCGNMVYKKRV